MPAKDEQGEKEVDVPFNRNGPESMIDSVRPDVLQQRRIDQEARCG